MYGAQCGYTPTPMVLQTPPRSLFYKGGPSSQPPVLRTDDTQWQSRSTLQLTTDEGEEDEGLRPQSILEGRHNEEEEAGIQLERRRNLACNRQPHCCGTHSDRGYE